MQLFPLVVLYVLTLGITLSFYNLLRKRSVRIRITSKKQTIITATEETDSVSENIPENATSTPIKTKTTASARKITPVNSRNMVTGVLNDSTNLGKKKTRPQRPQSLPPNERPSTSKPLFAPQPEIHPPPQPPSMPKALTASLPVFDGKSEKFELFEDLFRNNIKMYPHLTEIQKNQLLSLASTRQCTTSILQLRRCQKR